MEVELGAPVASSGEREPRRAYISSQEAANLGEAIVAGLYRPGQRLPTEMESAERLGISRSTYREALRILSTKGLVSARRKLGTVVTSRSEWNMFDPDVLNWIYRSRPNRERVEELFELRMVFEPSAAGVAARKRTNEDLTGLQSHLEVMRSHSMYSETWERAYCGFHTSILAATGNQLLQSMSGAIALSALANYPTEQLLGGVARDVFPDHVRVTQAIQERDAEAARSATVTLLTLAYEDYQRSG